MGSDSDTNPREKRSLEDDPVDPGDEDKDKDKDDGDGDDNDEPTPKRPRVSDTTGPVKRYYKKKCALMFGYVGTLYQGLQQNKSATHTVEDVLEEGLRKAGAILPCDGHIGRLKWSRSARTDKGVHAAANVVSFMMVHGREGLIEDINRFIPSDCRVFAYRRTTNDWIRKGFSAKQLCDRRRYCYLMPTSCFGSPSAAEVEEDTAPRPFIFTEEIRSKVQRVLNCFMGCKNFHNYTIAKSADDQSAKRYIQSFECSEPFMVEDMEFVRLTVLGQSFMLNQIRKMVAMTVMIVRDHDRLPGSVEDIMDATFAKRKYPLPKAPGTGLFLDHCFFTHYDATRGTTRGTLEFDEVKEQVEEFRMKRIFPEIARLEQKDHQCAGWVEIMTRHPIDYVGLLDVTAPPPVQNEEKEEGKQQVQES